MLWQVWQSTIVVDAVYDSRQKKHCHNTFITFSTWLLIITWICINHHQPLYSSSLVGHYHDAAWQSWCCLMWRFGQVLWSTSSGVQQHFWGWTRQRVTRDKQLHGSVVSKGFHAPVPMGHFGNAPSNRGLTFSNCSSTIAKNNHTVPQGILFSGANAEKKVVPVPTPRTIIQYMPEGYFGLGIILVITSTKRWFFGSCEPWSRSFLIHPSICKPVTFLTKKCALETHVNFKSSIFVGGMIRVAHWEYHLWTNHHRFQSRCS